MHYIGWVPNVTGHLSFTTIATGSFPSRCWRREADNRFIAVQRRDLLDVLVPFADSYEVVRFFREKLANLIIGVSGRFWYVLDAEMSADGERLSGTVYMVPAAKNGAYVKQLKSWLARSRDLNGYERIAELTQDASCYRADLELERAGKATIRPAQLDSDAELRSLLANQAFYFLKDISHVHQHHHPSHDAITEVTEIAIGQDDDKWTADTQFSLYRAIIRFKRFKNEKALFRAAGILAYAQSFDRSYGGENSLTKRFHVTELKESLSVGREELKHFQSKSLSVSETVRGFFFAAFGIVAAAGVFARLDGAHEFAVDQSLISFAQYTASSPWTVVGVTALVSLAWAIFSHRLDPSEFRIVRFYFRLIQGLRLRYAFLFNISVTLLLVFLSFLMLR